MIRTRIKCQTPRSPNTTKLTRKQRHSLNTIHVGSGRSWQIEGLPERKQLIRAVSVKEGNWLGMKNDFKKPFHIPYIDRRGKFSGCTLYRSSLTSQSYLSTLIGTVSRRLIQWSRSHQGKLKHKVYRNLETLIARISALYVLTKNSYMMDRCLVLLKNLEKNQSAIRGLLAFYVSKLDENKGFIYSQASKYAHWLTSRASRPRDKSRDQYNYFLGKVGVSNLAQRAEWIESCVYAVASAASQIGSLIQDRLRLPIW